MKTLLKKIWKWIKSFTIKNQVIILKLLNSLVLISIYIINNNPLIDVIIGLYIMLLIGIVGWKWFNKK